MPKSRTSEKKTSATNYYITDITITRRVLHVNYSVASATATRVAYRKTVNNCYNSSRSQ